MRQKIKENQNRLYFNVLKRQFLYFVATKNILLGHHYLETGLQYLKGLLNEVNLEVLWHHQ